MRILGRDLSKVVLVDNAAYSYAFQVNNGIPIISYFEGSTDYQLAALKDYLFELKKYEDVRICNKNMFKLEEYTKFTAVEEVV